MINEERIKELREEYVKLTKVAKGAVWKWCRAQEGLKKAEKEQRKALFALQRVECKLLDEIRGEEKDHMTNIQAGQVWRHQKSGKLYMVLAVAEYTGAHTNPDAKTDNLLKAEGFPENEKLVVYVGLYDNPHGNRPCARSLTEWLETVNIASSETKPITGQRFLSVS